MSKMNRIVFLAVTAFGLAACGGNDAQHSASTAETPDKGTIDKSQVADAARDDGFTTIPATPASIFRFDYKVIGTPIVGSPVSLDLHITSPIGGEPIDIAYHVVDASALAMPEAQPRELTAAPLAGESVVRERVTVIPQREGRMYFNVTAAIKDEDGTTSTVISIPLHVGDVDTGLQEHGELQTGPDGETTRVLRTD